MKNRLLPLFVVLASYSAYSQVGVGTKTPHSSAQLDVSAQNKGVLIPNVPLTSLTDNVTIKNAKESLLVFNTTNSSLITPGYYYWYDNRWNRIAAAGDGSTGKDGKSAYEVWTEIPGNEGKSVTDFINSLKGDKGDKGEVGIAGMSGTLIAKAFS